VAEPRRSRDAARLHARAGPAHRSVVPGAAPLHKLGTVALAEWRTSAPRHNLPAQPNQIIGREQDLATARQHLLRSSVRLLTLTGPPGVGKTRLAVDLAASVLSGFDDGVQFVDLSPIADTRLVMDAISRQLGLGEFSRRAPAEVVEEFLRDKSLLLVLDNFEQVLDAAADIGRLLAACADLKVLVTSRAPLHLRWESELPVAALRLPVLDSGPASDAVAASPAGQLFLERARTVVPNLELSEADAVAVANICMHLDGLPLGIELAAARIRLFPPRALLRRLVSAEHGEGRDETLLRLLASEAPDLPARQQTLLQAVAWSYDLLDAQEQAVFCRLSVFVGGCTLEAAEAVAGAGVKVIASLVEESLIWRDEQADGEPRLRMLEIIRAYARAQLSLSDEADPTLMRHADYFLDLAELSEPHLVGPDQHMWFARLERERGNLLAVERWAQSQAKADIVLRLATALWPVWMARGDAVEARDRLQPILPLVNEATASLTVARGLHAAGVLAERLGDYSRCRSLLERSLSVAREVADAPTLATALDSLGRQQFVEGRYAEARTLLDESHRLFRALNDRVGLARVLSHLGFLEYLEGRIETARATFSEGLAIAREVDDHHRIAEFMDNLGNTFQVQGDFENAASMFEEAVAKFRALGHAPWLAMALYNLGEAQIGLGKLDLARRQLSESLSMSRTQGDRRRLAYTLSAVATLAAAEGDGERAARLEAIATIAIAQIGARTTRRPNARQLLPARIAARAVELRTANASAQLPTLEAAADECLAWLAAPQQQRRSSAPVTSSPTTFERLTRRERDVVALLARGLTNRQIAAALVLTEGSAENYVQRVLSKLGFNNRAQVAAWAVEQGLGQAAQAAA
jgi:predicted ATPase/DNA-binding CsgD family transcriptional regulator